jgi:hypothetical protein
VPVRILTACRRAAFNSSYRDLCIGLLPVRILTARRLSKGLRGGAQETVTACRGVPAEARRRGAAAEPGYFFDPPHLPGAQPPGAQEPSLPAEELGDALGAAEATSVAATVAAGSARASAVFLSHAAIDKPASTVRAASTPIFMRGV